MTDDEVEIAVEGDAEVRAAKQESVQDVVDRVRSYQAGAPVETVRDELRSALAKAGLQVDDEPLQQAAQQISDERGVEVEQPGS